MKNIFKISLGSRPAFSLVEMLMALLVASLLMAALAPVITKRMNDSVNISVEGTIPGKKHMKHTIEYDDDNCKNKDIENNACTGNFTVPNGFNGVMFVTATGGGGGGGASMTTGSIEYKSAGTYSFKVPEGVNELEVTLVGGGAGGGAGWIDENIKGYAWTFSGALNRTYVPTSRVSENVKNVKVSGSSVSNTYSHGEATLSSDDTKYIANGKIYVSMSGGGGGGGQGTLGTGGGGGAGYKRENLVIANGNSYPIKVGAGGKSRACNGIAGCGGSASSFGSFLLAGGGGGGSWGWYNNGEGQYAGRGSKGENGGAETTILQECQFADAKAKYGTGGNGAAPGGVNAPNLECSSAVIAACVPGGNGGGSLFGAAGIYSYTANTNTRHGQGYGAGGCGTGTWGTACSSFPNADIGDTHAGNGAPGFVAAEWHEIANGGGGGGGGAMVPKKRIRVFPGETLTVVVGKEGKGGKAGYVNSLGNITKPENGTSGAPSLLKRGNIELIRTSSEIGANGQSCDYGACKGDTKGRCGDIAGCATGWIYDGYNQAENRPVGTEGAAHYFEGHITMKNTRFPGYKVTGGNAAGNNMPTGKGYEGVLTSQDGGGDGGQTTIDGKTYCTYGSGSTAINKAGGSATGYGGCGGGGGYGVTDGGDGAPGYVKIVWNPDKKGTGGGGGSGNTIVKQNITVKSGSIIKYQIGRGGDGGSVARNNTTDANLQGRAFINGQKGGDTIFGINSSIASNNYRITAGGGFGGYSPIITGNTTDVLSVITTNGNGGNKAAICKISNTLLICQGALDGKAGEDTKGGDGASSKYGEGGKGTSGYTGRSTETTGAGGGGSGVVETDSATTNDNMGGKGGNGQIIIEWDE